MKTLEFRSIAKNNSSNLHPGKAECFGVIRKALYAIGYDSEKLKSNYKYLSGSKAIASADLVAFGDSQRHDLATSCIAAKWLRNGDARETIIDDLSHTAAPAVLIATPQNIEVWLVWYEGNQIAHKKEHITNYGDFANYIFRNRLDLMPDALLSAKRGERQLSIFEGDLQQLLNFAQGITKDILVERFEKAVSAGIEIIDNSNRNESTHVTKLAIQLLAARVLEDKGCLDMRRADSAIELLNRARDKFRNYFDKGKISDELIVAAESIWKMLGPDVTFSTLTNEMLGHFYEQAFVTEIMRKKLRIYYTPSQIAHEMLRRLPIEDLAPENRVVLDGSCGSGSLLVAAHERLTKLLPANMPLISKHEYMLKHLSGMDYDGFATEIAGLSLLLFSLPAGDDWNISTGDFLKSSQSRQFKPNIIVGNPPFEEGRNKEKGRYQKAAEFLDNYLNLLSPGGLIGIILPETFLHNISCRDAREHLLNDCDIFEIWKLPAGIFQYSAFETTVILARKNTRNISSATSKPIRIRQVLKHSRDIEEFLSQGRSTYSYITDRSNAIRNDGKIIVSPFDCIWKRMAGLGKLGEIAEVFNGITPGAGRQELFSGEPRGQNPRKWLRGAGAIGPYCLNWENQAKKYVDYSKKLLGPRMDREEQFLSPKVIFNATRSPGNPWRIYAAIDESGFFPGKNLSCAVPEDATLEEIAAVLNSQVINAWVYSMIRTRNIDLSMLRELPFPRFKKHQRDEISSLVREISGIKKRQEDTLLEDPNLMSSLREKILRVDSLISIAYGLTNKERKKIEGLFYGFSRPGNEWKNYQQGRHKTDDSREKFSKCWTVIGSVIDVDVDRERLKVWFRGLKEGSKTLWIPIGPQMPGWALREGVDFRADIPWESRETSNLAKVSLTNFQPLEVGYLSDKELLEEVIR
jgi:type I restriction-modification system DNA methylase subunit